MAGTIDDNTLVSFLYKISVRRDCDLGICHALPRHFMWLKWQKYLTGCVESKLAWKKFDCHFTPKIDVRVDRVQS